MKKVLGGVLVVLLALALVACGNDGGSGADGADPIVGKYAFSSIEVSGMSMTAAEMEASGADISTLAVEVKEDGTFTMEVGALAVNDTSSAQGTWVNNDGSYEMTANGDTITVGFDASAGTITMEMDGGKLVFKK